jgi:nucleotide-binding universal stress UspA family protein
MASADLFMIQLRRIVYATDFSPSSEPALTWAVELAEQNRAELVVVHVLPPPTPIFEVDPVERPGAEAKLSALMQKVPRTRPRIRRLLVKGRTGVAKHIVELARILNADLIIIGTQGRTGLARFFTGGTASMVIAKSSCPVLVVPGRRQRTISGSGVCYKVAGRSGTAAS